MKEKELFSVEDLDLDYKPKLKKVILGLSVKFFDWSIRIYGVYCLIDLIF